MRGCGIVCTGGRRDEDNCAVCECDVYRGKKIMEEILAMEPVWLKGDLTKIVDVFIE